MMFKRTVAAVLAVVLLGGCAHLSEDERVWAAIYTVGAVAVVAAVVNDDESKYRKCRNDLLPGDYYYIPRDEQCPPVAPIPD